MKKATILSLLLIQVFTLIQIGTVLAQTITVQGKITDAKTGDPVPFANVVVKGTTLGATTDFQGLYNLTIEGDADSLVASYIGYKTKTKPLNTNPNQILNFQLTESVETLEEVVFVAKENPAWPIMRQVVAHKSDNSKQELTAYEYESYTKIEIALDNLSDRFRNPIKLPGRTDKPFCRFLYRSLCLIITLGVSPSWRRST